MTAMMDFLARLHSLLMEQELSIPAIQLVYYLGLINILMLLRRYRLCYLLSLGCSLYWLLVLNRAKFGALEAEFASRGWLFSGGLAALLLIALFCFLTQPKD